MKLNTITQIQKNRTPLMTTPPWVNLCPCGQLDILIHLRDLFLLNCG